MATRLIYNFSAFLLLRVNTQHALCHIHFKNNSKIPAQNLWCIYVYLYGYRTAKKSLRAHNFAPCPSTTGMMFDTLHKNRNNTHSPSSQTMCTYYTLCMVFLLFKNAQNCDDDTHTHTHMRSYSFSLRTVALQTNSSSWIGFSKRVIWTKNDSLINNEFKKTIFIKNTSFNRLIIHTFKTISQAIGQILWILFVYFVESIAEESEITNTWFILS